MAIYHNRVIGSFLEAMTYIAIDSLPYCQICVLSYAVGLKCNQTVVDFQFNICDTVVPLGMSCQSVYHCGA